jgi:hypothetical protein
LPSKSPSTFSPSTASPSSKSPSKILNTASPSSRNPPPTQRPTQAPASIVIAIPSTISIDGNITRDEYPALKT